MARTFSTKIEQTDADIELSELARLVAEKIKKGELTVEEVEARLSDAD